jgi:hypothetical protein
MKTWARVGLAAAAAYLLLGNRKGDVSSSNSISSGKDFFRIAQGDSRWAKLRVGVSSQEMEDVGCFFTSLIAARNMLLDGALLPPAAMPTVVQAGGFQGAGLVLPTAARVLGVSAPENERIRANAKSVSDVRAKADDILTRGGIPIFNVGYNSRDPRHFIVCNRKSAAGYECMDVAGPSSTLMKLDSNLIGVRNASKTYMACGVAGVFRS